jgi:hypothetical protein
VARRLRRIALIGAAALVVMQFVPYGWRHGNPTVTADAPWPSARSEAIARASCYGCHSNETDWPVYSYVAPMSWLVRYDVDAGREKLNFSEWDREQEEDGHDAAETVEDKSMPPWRYTMIHRDARMSAAERAELIAALEAMDEGGNSSGRGPGRGRGRGGDDD